MSIRIVKRWCKSHFAEYKNAPRVKSVTRELSEALKQEVILISAGAAGRDSIYWVESHAGRIAVLRLVNPFKKRTPMPPDSPFVWLDDSQRITYEWNAYSKGAITGVTPEPLWCCDDAVVCRYLPWTPLFDRLKRYPETFWDVICLATKDVARLHAAGLVHMDASLANLLVDPVSDKTVFVDFEYGPAEFLNEGQQRAYDYLRMVESAIKFCPVEELSNFQPWINLLDSLVGAEFSDVDISPLYPALGRILNNVSIHSALKSVFKKLA